MKLYMFAVAALLGVSTQAMAADLPQMNAPMAPAPTMSTTYDWNGFYAGIAIGRENVNISTSGPSDVQPDGNAFVGGIFAGANYQMDNLVLGIEGNIDKSNFSKSATCNNPSYTCNTNIDFEGAVVGRVGFAMDNFLFYGLGGVAAAKYGGNTDDGTVYKDSSTRVGWTAGLGLDVGLTENVFARLEYRHADYGKRDMTYDSTYPDVDVSSNTFKVGAGVKF